MRVKNNSVASITDGNELHCGCLSDTLPEGATTSARSKTSAASGKKGASTQMVSNFSATSYTGPRLSSMGFLVRLLGASPKPWQV
jgi:hypothetical protein